MTGLTDRQIAGCFNVHDGPVHGVRLIGGAAEPLYLPAGPATPALIRYTQDYARSALHELAHWCLAGRERRSQIDYGYWYQPPPRSRVQQAQFMAAEVPVQALESLFARACGLSFRVSVDDFDITTAEEAAFSEAVAERARCLEAGGLPRRAQQLGQRFERFRESLGPRCTTAAGFQR
ncbi:MAG: elongation factor P hydroxylase [Pseudomonadales bacterium]|nr:elongation factor P hydroxylase [Pseudomonadales bacterium]